MVVAGHRGRGVGVPAAATPGPPSSPTAWPTGTGPRRTTRSPTSAHGSGAAPRPTSCCRRSRRPPAKRCTHNGRSSVSRVRAAPVWLRHGRKPRHPSRATTRLMVRSWCRSRMPRDFSARSILTLPPGRDIRPLEHRLLSDIAEQAALALRNVRLELELAERVRQLDRHTRELAASRNRIMGAVDTERRRLESSIAGRVLPTMVRLRAEVARAATDGAQAERIEECVDLATEAVESLRELTRGIYPTNLTRSGLGSALRHGPQRCGGPTRSGSTLPSRPRGSPSTSRRRRTTAAWRCSSTPPARSVLTLDDRGDLVLVIHGVDVDALNRLAIVDRIEACGGALHVPDPASGNALQIRFPALAPVPAPGPDGRLDPTTPAAGVPG